jgi:hypothetical protein
MVYVRWVLPGIAMFLWGTMLALVAIVSCSLNEEEGGDKRQVHLEIRWLRFTTLKPPARNHPANARCRLHRDSCRVALR